MDHVQPLSGSLSLARPTFVPAAAWQLCQTMSCPGTGEEGGPAYTCIMQALLLLATLGKGWLPPLYFTHMAV